MKLPGSGIEVETGGLLKEHDFSISTADQGLIFELLRSKMYKNPIGSICREVASNSRDANREVGKGDVPIKITIYEPNQFLNISDLAICFEDEGPGISPERMVNIFIQYAASTKRDSDSFTGGFGLGAKTPFAYSDVFNIVTIHDKIKYHYTAYIDPSRKGKMTELEVLPTDEPNGTKIVIPLKKEDRAVFEKDVINATMFWDVKPKLINFRTGVSYPKFESLFEGTNYSICKFENSHYTQYGSVSHIATIDGIGYPIDQSICGLPSFNELKVVLKYPNGILNISSNRETLQYDKPTIETVKLQVKQVVEDVVKTLNDKFAAFTDLFQALYFYRCLHGRYGTTPSDANDRSLYNYVNNNGSLAQKLPFIFDKKDLAKINNEEFKYLYFSYYGKGEKSERIQYEDARFLKTPIYYATKLDRKKIDTLLEDGNPFIILTLRKPRLSKYDIRHDTAANIAAKQARLEDFQKKELERFQDFKMNKNLDDVQQTVKPRAKIVRQTIVAVPVRASRGNCHQANPLSGWGSQDLKYDKTSNKFIFDKHNQIIYILVKNLASPEQEDLQAAIVGQYASFFLDIPVVAVNVKHAARFKEQLTVEAALKKCDPVKLQSIFDFIKAKDLDVVETIELWSKKLKFDDATTKVFTDILKAAKIDASKLPYIQNNTLTAAALKTYKLDQSTTLDAAIKSFSDIEKKFPLLEPLSNSIWSGNKETIQAINDYIEKMQ